MDLIRWYTEYTTTAIWFRAILGIALFVMMIATYIDYCKETKRQDPPESVCPLCGQKFMWRPGQRYCELCNQRLYKQQQQKKWKNLKEEKYYENESH